MFKLLFFCNLFGHILFGMHIETIVLLTTWHCFFSDTRPILNLLRILEGGLLTTRQGSGHWKQLGEGQVVLDQTGLDLLLYILGQGRSVWLGVISAPVYDLFNNEITDNFADVVTATIENCY